MATAEVDRVLDTSIAVAWFFIDDVQHGVSVRVLEAIGDAPDAFGVPDLFYSELIHVLARKSGGDARFVEDAVTAVLGLGLRSLRLTTSALRVAASLACGALAGYDATFVAIAQELGARWLTADEDAARVAGPAAEPLSSFDRA